YSKEANLYPVCHAQEDEKCARHCYWRYFSSQEDREDLLYWKRWVRKRMSHIREEIVPKIDLFIAPSRYLMERFVGEFFLDPSTIVYLDYGFLREKLTRRKRTAPRPFTFGYIGTHKQAKGISLLIQAFCEMDSAGAELKIWGAPVEPFT